MSPLLTATTGDTVAATAPDAKRRRVEVLSTAAIRPAFAPLPEGLHHITDECALRTFLARPVDDANVGGETSALFLVYAEWDEAALPSDRLAAALLTPLAVPIALVDASAVGAHVTRALLQLDTEGRLPVAVLWRFDASAGGGAKVHEKPLAEYCDDAERLAGALNSSALLPAVHDSKHLRRILRTGGEDGFTVVYFGASWCPPCARILKTIPHMLKELPTNIRMVKADRDAAESLNDAHQVQLIPTFAVFRNLGEGVDGPDTPLASLQCSDHATVRDFLRAKCTRIDLSGIGDDLDF